MKTLQHTLLKLLPLTVSVVALLAAGSCSRDEDATRNGGRRELAVNVQMQNSDWQTRSGADGTSGGSSTADGTQVLGAVALDEQLEIVAECEPIGYTPDAPLTRGTPMNSASELKSMGFAVYTNSAFTKNCTATYAGGSWNIANNIILDLDKNKYSYYAYAPVVTDDNGIKLNEADGKKLTYTAPADITKQPDLCWATPIIDDQTGTVTFAMQHALTAVGIKVRAANVEIKSIKFEQVSTAGTLNLTTGAWGGVGTPSDLTFALSNNKPSTGDGVVDITPSDGYLMLPPQGWNDNKKLVIVYRYTGETTDRTGTHKLSDITGGAWTAGQKVNYVIQLKSNFSLNLNPASATVQYTAGSYTLNYTTGSSASSDPTATCGASWITGLAVNRSTGKISFNYAANTVTVARKTEITVTSGFTTKDFVFTQTKAPGVLIAGTMWTDANLTGNASTNSGHRMETNPQDRGMFFKWGTTFVYQRTSSNSDGGGWGGETTGAATSPSSGSGTGYDYGSGLAGGLNPGDPCQKLGTNYKTPTRNQWLNLKNSGTLWSKYNGIEGYFFGSSASSCNNSTIQPGCIFIPTSSYRSYLDGTQSSTNNTGGRYWSSSVTADGGRDDGGSCCRFVSFDITINTSNRGYGYSVRCIYE